MTDSDRMQVIDHVPGIDPSGDRSTRTDWSVYRDYDLLHFPAAILDLAGIAQARTALAVGEWEITAYLARERQEEGDGKAMARARASLAAERITYAVALIGSARDMIAVIASDRNVDTESGPWADLLETAGGAFLPDYSLLLRAIERAAGEDSGG